MGDASRELTDHCHSFGLGQPVFALPQLLNHVITSVSHGLQLSQAGAFAGSRRFVSGSVTAGDMFGYEDACLLVENECD